LKVIFAGRYFLLLLKYSCTVLRTTALHDTIITRAWRAWNNQRSADVF